MSDDIATRLRKEVAKAENDGRLPSWELAKCAWAAADEIERLRSVSAMLTDEIERLRAEVARLGSFLHPIGTVIDERAVYSNILYDEIVNQENQDK